MSEAPPVLTAPIDGDTYVREVLTARQAAYMAAQSTGTRAVTARFPPLLEWFIRDEDVRWVDIPAEKPAPKRARKPRVYRSAASIAEELATVEARMAAIAGSGPDDPAAVNISPFARSRAARRAGRARFEKLDRNLERYTALSRRRDNLKGRLASAKAREAEAAAAALDESK